MFDLDTYGFIMVMVMIMLVQGSFPGHPPRALQRLFYGTSKLRDKDPLTVVLKDSGVVILPIILDMVPPLR